MQLPTTEQAEVACSVIVSYISHLIPWIDRKVCEAIFDVHMIAKHLVLWIQDYSISRCFGEVKMW